MPYYKMLNQENQNEQPPNKEGWRTAVKIVLILIKILVLFKLCSAQQVDKYYFRALAEKEYKNYKNSITNLDTAIFQNPNNNLFLIERAQIKMILKNYNSAINDLKKAEKIKPNSATYYLAQCYSYLNNVDSAMFFLAKHVNYYDKRTKPDIVLDSAFFNINKTNQWKIFWQKNYYSKVEIMIQNVEFNIKHYQTTLALDEVNQIIKKYKKYHKAYFLKAKLLYDGGNYKLAKKIISKAIKINSLQPEYFNLRGEVYIKLNKNQKATEDFKQSLTLNPYQPDVYYLLARSQHKSKDYNLAVNSIKNYTTYFYKDHRAFFLEAQINYDAGNFLDAIKTLNTLISVYPKNANYYFLRGKSYLNTHSYKLAYNDFNTCLDIKPQLTDTYFYRGQAEFEMNMTDAACADWKRSIKYKDYKANDYFYEYCKDYKY